MSKTKTIKIFFVIFIVLLAIGSTTYFLFGKLMTNTNYESPKQEVTKGTQPTRQQTVEQLISKLQAEREQDPTFKAESARMERELETEIANMRNALKAHRKAQSRLDALTIVQVQYDVEIAALQANDDIK